MRSFRPGDQVKIPCHVQSGAFPEEYLVTFETEKGPVSGFVGQEDLVDLKGDCAFVLAVVRNVSDSMVTVDVHGSFFTTTGLAYVQQSRLQQAYS